MTTSTQSPKDIITYVYDPKKKFYHIVVHLKNEPGTMASATSLLARSKINILSGFISADSKSEVGVWSFFAEAGNRNIQASDLRKLLESSDNALSVIVNESRDGFLLDSVHFPLLSGGQRSALVSQGMFASMLRRLRELFGSGGALIVYEAGFADGKGFMEDFLHFVGTDFVAKNLAYLILGYSSIGWFRAELRDRTPDLSKVTIRVSDSFECADQHSAKPYSQFIRGNLCGMFSAITETKMKCAEMACVARGDEYCEFAISNEAVKSNQK